MNYIFNFPYRGCQTTTADRPVEDSTAAKYFLFFSDFSRFFAVMCDIEHCQTDSQRISIHPLVGKARCV